MSAFWVIFIIAAVMLFAAVRIAGPRPRCQHCGQACRPGTLLTHEWFDHAEVRGRASEPWHLRGSDE